MIIELLIIILNLMVIVIIYLIIKYQSLNSKLFQIKRRFMGKIDIEKFDIVVKSIQEENNLLKNKFNELLKEQEDSKELKKSFKKLNMEINQLKEFRGDSMNYFQEILEYNKEREKKLRKDFKIK